MSSHRPTWTPATGASLAPTFQYSSKDLNSHTHLKLRHNLELQQVQRKSENEGAPGEEEKDRNVASGEYDDEDFTFGHQAELPEEPRTGQEGDLSEGKEEETLKRKREANNGGHGSDQNNDNNSDGQESEAEVEEEMEEEEDDTEALLRELENIKREREEERQRRALEEQEARKQEAASSNPLILDGAATFTVKRRWDDDVVFRNQAKGVEDRPQKRFINDTLRSDFHRKFLDRYIK